MHDSSKERGNNASLRAEKSSVIILSEDSFTELREDGFQVSATGASIILIVPDNLSEELTFGLINTALQAPQEYEGGDTQEFELIFEFEDKEEEESATSEEAS